MIASMAWLSTAFVAVGMVGKLAEQLTTILNVPDVGNITAKTEVVCNAADQIIKYMTGSETTLGPDVNRLSHTARRAVIHLSGVFACNFANAMYANAAEVLASAGLPFDIVAPVIEETAKKAVEVLNPAATQTGPARRGDTQTLDRHRAMLADRPRKREIYDKVSEDICERTKISKSF